MITQEYIAQAFEDAARAGGTHVDDDPAAGQLELSPDDCLRSARFVRRLDAPTKNMTFGLAIEALRNGKRVARAGWNGKSMWLRLVGPADGPRGEMLPYGDGSFCKEMPRDAFIEMKTVGDTLVPWLASQTDVLATDWMVVP